MPTIVSIGEALVEVMRTERDRPLDQPALFSGPYPSGAPAILASAAARLGASVGFIGTVGDDAFGDCIARRLVADGIDCRALRRTSERPTGTAFVAYRSDGSRTFLFHTTQSAAVLVLPDQIPADYMNGVRYLHIMGSALASGDSLRQTCYRAAEIVYARGGTISLDPNLRPELMPLSSIRDVCEPILRLSRIVCPSGMELATLTGAGSAEEGAAQLLRRGLDLVALKQGERGSTLFSREGTLPIPPFTVTEIDPTGAGDCYDAALLVGLSEGWPLSKAGLFANAVGALATTRLGPMEGAFARQEVLDFMASQGRPLPPL
jgi:sugar/nucleoside kinase (ribokinase family)